MSGDPYTVIAQPPNVADYCHLRAATGLSPKTTEAAAQGLAGTWFGVSVLYEDRVVGTGRIIGDGGCFFQIVDIAVLPEHQGQGLGKRIMQALVAYLEQHAPPSA
ncbi:MAG: GNAT family N-acetyltransferase, partial [Cyanobacteria bacterium P01_G01_bin.67]